MSWRALELDGQVLLFDRTTGTNMLVENERTKPLVRVAPRQVQISLTNACDKSCSFCYRPLDARSRWTFEGILELARFLDQWGVLEIAFGGGEPTLFPRFAELLHAIWNQTGLCPSFTTHGGHLTPELLRAIKGAYGQLQVSVYDEDDTGAVIDLLVREGARFGLNYLVTPARVKTLEADVMAFAARGVRDMLFLSYKGDDALHLSRYDLERFDRSLAKLHRLFGSRVTLKVDVCWASRLVHTPQLLDGPDCGANIDFLSITSDRKVLSCSFVHGGEPFDDVSEVRAIWQRLQSQRIAAGAGCARVPEFGLAAGKPRLPVIA